MSFFSTTPKTSCRFCKNVIKTTEAVRDELPHAPVIAPKVREVAALVERETWNAEHRS